MVISPPLPLSQALCNGSNRDFTKVNERWLRIVWLGCYPTHVSSTSHCHAFRQQCRAMVMLPFKPCKSGQRLGLYSHQLDGNIKWWFQKQLWGKLLPPCLIKLNTFPKELNLAGIHGQLVTGSPNEPTWLGILLGLELMTLFWELKLGP